jgi:Arc/MetJ-type ribon-helix-helix transcriptional regulator
MACAKMIGEAGAMNIVLSRETQKLLEDCMQNGNYSTPDEAVRIALENLDSVRLEHLDAETLKAIEQSEAQIDRGEYRDWEDVKEELRDKYLGK